MKTQLLISLLILICCKLSLADLGAGPHGGSIVENDSRKFEVKLDPEMNHVEVYDLGGQKKPTPKNMTITLFRDSGAKQSVELRALNLRDPMPKYQGELSLGAGSYVGAELSFRTSVKSLEVLKFVPTLPSRSGGR